MLSAGYYKLNMKEVIKYSYYKWHAKNLSHKLTNVFSVLHILGQELHSLYSKNGGYKLMAALYDYTRGDTS